MLAKIKQVLRITSDAFDDEIQDLIAAARQDLILTGVSPSLAENDEDPLIRRAITIYVKAHFGWDNPDAEQLKRSYDLLKMHLTLSAEYTGVGEP